MPTLVFFFKTQMSPICENVNKVTMATHKFSGDAGNNLAAELIL